MKSHTLSAAVLLLGMSVLPAVAQPVKFSAILPVTGNFASYTQEMRVGFEIAQEDIAKKGGIQGRPLDLAYLDTQSNPGQVATLIRQACSDSLFTLAGLSTESRVALPVANAEHCPAIAVIAAAVGLAENNRPWAFAFMTPSDVITSAATDTILDKTQPKQAVLIVEKADPASVDYANQVDKTLTKRGVKFETLTVASSDLDFGPAVTRAAASSPDLIIISTLDRASMGLLKELRKAGQKARVMLTQASYNGQVGALPADVLENVYRYAQAEPAVSTDPRMADFVARFKAKSNGRTPSLVATLAYDSLSVACDAADAAGLSGKPADLAADRQKLIDKLLSMKDWPGLGGTVSMTPKGYMYKSPLVLLYHDAKWNEVTN